MCVPEGTTWLIYVDDSGDQKHDLLTALCFPVGNWATYLDGWKKYRRHLLKRVGFPLGCEFHSQTFLKRKLSVFDPQTETSVKIPYEVLLSNGDKISRPKLFEAGLRTIAACENIRVLTCYSPSPNGAAKMYGPLLVWIEEFLISTDSHGIVWFDGMDEGMALIRRLVHRGLDIRTRRVLEDGIPLSSVTSHFIQMADAVAYSALRAVRRDGPPHLRDSYLYLTNRWFLGGIDSDGFPCVTHPLGFREVAPRKQ